MISGRGRGLNAMPSKVLLLRCNHLSWASQLVLSPGHLEFPSGQTYFLSFSLWKQTTMTIRWGLIHPQVYAKITYNLDCQKRFSSQFNAHRCNFLAKTNLFLHLLGNYDKPHTRCHHRWWLTSKRIPAAFTLSLTNQWWIFSIIVTMNMYVLYLFVCILMQVQNKKLPNGLISPK
jgi:hypothetical protein